jgi:putative PIN family toxin of toxin-antitoxin system
MRVVLDTNILVRAAVSRAGPASELLGLICSRQDHTLILSPAILAEVQAVLNRPYFSSRILDAEREAFRLLLATVSELVVPAMGPGVIEDDPADDAVLYAASTGQADAICTRNAKHFLGAAAAAFCAERRIRVLGDLELLDELRRVESG